ncbi:MAG: bifunctional hydroxymethylpyrimidine kinase/phosphomethylpyrimidine kinase [Sedimenticolaceae bacterium]
MINCPRILCIGGLDPTGGAGVQADIETVAALGGQAMTLVTALTVQDSRDIQAIYPTPIGFFKDQLDVLMRDIRPDAVKIGLIGSIELVPLLNGLLQAFEGPVVIDPVLAAGGGYDLDRGEIAALIANQLLQSTTLITPNRAEARRLSGQRDVTGAAQALLQAGVGAVLITGADEASGNLVENQLFTADGRVEAFDWPRLAQQYHGSGCTLASACATQLALGDDLRDAALAAQRFAWHALERGAPAGAGQWLPRRLG